MKRWTYFDHLIYFCSRFSFFSSALQPLRTHIKDDWSSASARIVCIKPRSYRYSRIAWKVGNAGAGSLSDRSQIGVPGPTHNLTQNQKSKSVPCRSSRVGHNHRAPKGRKRVTKSWIRLNTSPATRQPQVAPLRERTTRGRRGGGPGIPAQCSRFRSSSLYFCFPLRVLGHRFRE